MGSRFILFVSSFCSKCIYVRRLLKEVIGDRFEEINISDNAPEIMKFKPTTVPTLILLHDGEVIVTLSGIMNSNTLEAVLHLYLTLQSSDEE